MYSFNFLYQTGYINVKGVSDYIGKFWSKQTFPNGSDPQLFASSNAANRCVHLRHYNYSLVRSSILSPYVRTYIHTLYYTVVKETFKNCGFTHTFLISKHYYNEVRK